MKKIICVLFVLAMLMTMVGCSGNKQFDSESAMMEYLNGMWVVDNNREDRTYYIFRDNKIYNISDTVFVWKLEELFDSFVADGRLTELCKLDFATAIDALSIETILEDFKENVVLQPGKGKVIIDQGMTYEKSIIIADDAVSIKEVDEKVGTTLNKLSDTEDFATEHFESLFNQALDNYQIPSSYFLMDTKEYGEAIKSTIPSFDWWSLVQSKGDLQAYKPNEALTSLNGSCLIITKESLTYLYKTSVSTGFIGQKHEELLSLIYNPEKGSCEITTVNTSNMNAHSLIAYCIYATQNIPGAYTDPTMLYNDMTTKGETKRTDYDTTITMKSNGLEYLLRITYDGVPADFNVQVDNTISLKQIMDANEKSQGTDAQDTPSQSGNASNDSNTSNSGNASNGGDTTNNGNTSNGGNTSNSGDTSQQPTSCTHNYANATCTAPKICTRCGETSGSALGHTYSAATCTAPKTCILCGEINGSALGHNWNNATCLTPQTCITCGTTTGSTASHKWKTATCTMPEYCTACNETRGEALGHQMLFTKCKNDSCNYVDYSCIADTYTNVSVDAYLVGTTTWVDVNVTNVSISHSGVLSFTFNEKNYNLTVKQNNKSQDHMGYFSCYLDGVLIEDVDFRAGNQSYYNAIYLDRFIADGYRLYIYATR